MAVSGNRNWDVLFEKARRSPRDDRTWSALYGGLWPYLTDWVMSRYGLDPDHAGEVLQDTFQAYREELSEGRIAHASLSHLRAFVRFRVLSLLHRQSRLVPLDEIAPPSDPSDPETDLLNKLIIDEALERLDQRCAYILRERYFAGRTSAEIAATLGLEAGNVDVLLHRCRARCRELLESLRHEPA